MKLIAFLSAGALAMGAIASTPAEAQRWDGHRDRGWHDGGRRHGGWRDHRGYGWRGGGYRARTVCRVHRGPYGPVRRCFRGYR